MTAAQRLELLKEVGGSTVYEERRNESQKLLEETERRRIKVSGEGSVAAAGCQMGLSPQLTWGSGVHCGPPRRCCAGALTARPVNRRVVLCVCRSRAAQIDETAKDIEEQITQINADRAELLAYQALDKRQRGIEYALLDRELTSARKELSKVQQRHFWVAGVLACAHAMLQPVPGLGCAAPHLQLELPLAMLCTLRHPCQSHGVPTRLL